MAREDIIVAFPNPDEQPGGVNDEVNLRPRTLQEFIGQEALKARLEVMIGASLIRERPVDHLLFAGPPGLGKTTLAGIVATEMNASIQITSGPALERAGDLAAILSKLEYGDVLFVDEIHRMPKTVEEVLYPAMEDHQIDVVIGKGPAARSLRFELEPFTLVGATTRTGLITKPLRDRFGYEARLELYNQPELEAIVKRAAGIHGIEIDDDGAAEIASRGRGTPRIAIRLLNRVRDYALVKGPGHITEDAAIKGLAMFGIDQRGLDKVDLNVLETLCVKFGGGPVGRSNLAISVGEPQETLEDVIEPFLIEQGFLMRTAQGRMATPEGWHHIGRTPPTPAAPSPDTLFD